MPQGVESARVWSAVRLWWLSNAVHTSVTLLPSHISVTYGTVFIFQNKTKTQGSAVSSILASTNEHHQDYNNEICLVHRQSTERSPNTWSYYTINRRSLWSRLRYRRTGRLHHQTGQAAWCIGHRLHCWVGLGFKLEVFLRARGVDANLTWYCWVSWISLESAPKEIALRMPLCYRPDPHNSVQKIPISRRSNAKSQV